MVYREILPDFSLAIDYPYLRQSEIFQQEGPNLSRFGRFQFGKCVGFSHESLTGTLRFRPFSGDIRFLDFSESRQERPAAMRGGRPLFAVFPTRDGKA
jgi:hypothetical protein